MSKIKTLIGILFVIIFTLSITGYVFSDMKLTWIAEDMKENKFKFENDVISYEEYKEINELLEDSKSPYGLIMIFSALGIIVSVLLFALDLTFDVRRK